MTDPNEGLPRKTLKVMQIIASALPLGVTVFLILALALVHFQVNGLGQARGGNLFVITLVAGFLLMGMTIVSFVMPGILTRNGLAKIVAGNWQPPRGSNAASFTTDASKLLALRQTSMMIALAPLEGAAFLGCVAYLVEGRPIALAIVVVAVLFMLMNFPTESRVRAWLETQSDQLALLRHQG